MGSDPPDLGKGLFGYRKSVVNQIIADRDIMLRQAEGRVRAAEAKVAELENEISSFRDRNARMDEQLERLRSQLEVVLARTEAGYAAGTPESEQGAGTGQAADYEEGFGPGHGFPSGDRFPPGDFGTQPADQPPPPPAEPEIEPQAYGWSTAEETVAAIAPQVPSAPEAATAPPASEQNLPEWARSQPAEGDQASDLLAPDEEALPEEGEGAERPPSLEPPWMARLAEQRRAPAGESWESATPSQEPAPPAADLHEPQPETSAAPQSQPEPQPEPATQAAAFPEEPRMSVPPPDIPYGREAPEWTAQPPAAPEPGPSQAAPPPPPAPPEPAPRRDDVTSRFLTEELAGILAAAEESAARIVDRARASTQRQIMESNRLWREVQAEVARFASWRDQVEPAIRQVQSKVDSVRGLVDDVPERIRQALAPMADAISSIDVDMAELASALTPPLLLTPSGLEGEDQSWLSRAAETTPGYEPDEETPGQGAQPYEGGDTPGPFGAEAG